MTAIGDAPAELNDDVTLPNQRRLHIRALRRFEDAPVRDLYSHLSPRSRYLRFFSPMPTLPESVVRLLVSVDYRQRLSLVAEEGEGEAREVVALAGFGAVDDTNVEVSIVVRDDWQRQVSAPSWLAGSSGPPSRAGSTGSSRTSARKTSRFDGLLGRLGDVVFARASAGISGSPSSAAPTRTETGNGTFENQDCGIGTCALAAVLIGPACTLGAREQTASTARVPAAAASATPTPRRRPPQRLRPVWRDHRRGRLLGA